MPDPSALLAHWGYAAIFVAVVLGNFGLPVPEESILAMAGYAVWRHDLHVPTVLAVGILSAVVGDNLGYWLGRRYGRRAIERYGRGIGMAPERLERLTATVTRYGGLAVLVGRFLPGLRFLAGPLAGATGLPPRVFLVANVLGAVFFVPYAVGLGYAVGYGLGTSIERLVRGIERGVVLGAAGVAITVLAIRVLRARGRRE